MLMGLELALMGLNLFLKIHTQFNGILMGLNHHFQGFYGFSPSNNRGTRLRHGS